MEPWDPNNPTIFVDHREQASGLIEALLQYDLFEIQRQALECCDLQICDMVFERKSANDLIDSLQSGRLFRQLILMRRLYRRRALLVEGDIPVQRLSARQQEGLWVRISVGLQTPILRTRDVQHSANIIHRAALQIFGFTNSQATVGLKSRGSDAAFFQALALISIPGIGLTRARSLLAHFGSLKAVINADRSDLMSVQGIGPHHADLLISTASFAKGG